jgi:hypothetical protein
MRSSRGHDEVCKALVSVTVIISISLNADGGRGPIDGERQP